MSIKVMEWVWNHSDARDGQLLVLLAIADNANHDGGNAFPSIAELSRKSRLSQRGVQYALRGLEESGNIVTSHQAGPGGCNQYRVVMTPADIAPPHADSAPPADIAGVQSVTPGGEAHCTPPVQPTAPVTVLEPTTNPKEDTSAPAADPIRDDVERLCRHLVERIVDNGSKQPTINKEWRKAARLLMDKDGRSEQEIHAAIDWCQSHTFWRPNILSMPKLRDKYDQMRLQAERGSTDNKQAQTDSAYERARQRAAARQQQTHLEIAR